MVAPRFGIGLAQGAQEPPEASRQHLDAVIVDGEFMRDAHGSAYPALKSVINQEKDSMCTAAAEDRRHLVIPQTMLNLDKGLTEVVQLSCQGYTNHVVAVVAPLEDCQRRGAARELETGKRYEPREFRKSIDSIWPMISACNGRYELLHAVEPEAKVRRLEYRTLASGLCRKSPIYERPVAVWVLGPARVGKSALTPALGGSFDVLEPAEGAGCRVDGVLVDGNIFREAHSVYQQWAEAASPAAAASAFKSTSDREKDLLVTKAALCHKNIVMGRRLTDLNKGLTEIEGLKWQGYTNHVVAVVATFEECQRRAGPEGARCTRRDYDASLRAIPPMIAACNGRYAILRPAERPEPSDAPILFSCRCQGQGVPEGGSATSLAFSSLESLTREVEQALAQDGD
ncbi:unnamed protein product [Prorocentrum cordatum]|uniref:Zeta toxin domain-containing protein n=1 Tax=Prorocentrum cordatum TaxID=2364126 RepID=A0ABN9PQN3_9DINO|nr:unnamed protein product [Polarella glacialis]